MATTIEQQVTLDEALVPSQADSRFSFNEHLDTPIDFSNFIMNLLGVDTLTPELLAGPTYELMRGSCTNLTELEYHLEEVYKATTDRLDWVNPEGQQYPHNLLQPLPLIPNNQGRRVIPFAHFINNDLEYLRGGTSSRKYTTSVTKTKAGRKRQQFYRFAVNRESALDVYSKRRIIAVTDLKIVEWHNYKHLYWILRRVEDLQLGVGSYQKRFNLTKPDTYRSDLKRREAYNAYSNPRVFIYQNKDKKNRLMRIDELHKLSDGTLNDVCNALDDRLKEIRMQLGASYYVDTGADWITVLRDDDKLYKFKEGDFKRMFTRSIVILRCVEDLQLGVESYQKRLNLTKLDTYRFNLKRREADGTLNDVRNALDDHLKGFRMRYLPQTIWRKSDKDRAAAMIQDIDKMLKTMRIMRSLERFVGGRLYEGDFRMLQRTI
nr:hypothetical protein [Tanacetum cinerariifolium]